MDLLSNLLRRPTAADDKYSRGVVGFITGSAAYPGAAILGVSAAIRTGIGMARYVGPESVGRLVLEVRPEVVLQSGRVQAWVVGSGVPADEDGEQAQNIQRVLAEPGYVVIDAGALALADFARMKAKAIITPHAGEMASLLTRLGANIHRESVEIDPIAAATLGARLTGQVVLLKGNVTTIASPDGSYEQTPSANPALATAGSGDVLAGILGALLAANADRILAGEFTLAQIALAGVALHSAAAEVEAASGPIAALDLTDGIRSVVGGILA